MIKVKSATLTKTTACKYCGAEIGFIKTKTGKSLPVDPVPICFVPEDEKGRFVLADGTVKSGTAITETSEMMENMFNIGYQSHFATCPNADEARKKNKSERTKEK